MRHSRLLYIFSAITFSFTITPYCFATGSIEIFTLDKEIGPTEDIFVTGFVSAESEYKPVELQVIDPNGNLLYNPSVHFNENGQFRWLIHPPLGKFDLEGTYTIIALHEEVSETFQLQVEVIQEKHMAESFSSLKSGNNSNFVQETLFESNEYSGSKTDFGEDGLAVKTSSSDENQIDRDEIEEFLSTNDFVFLIPVLIAVIVGIVVIWMKATSGNQIKRGNLS